MPEVKIRPAVADDLPVLMAMDHSCLSEFVWQMEIQHDDERHGAIFGEIHLPRAVQVKYPRPASELSQSWSRRSGMLVAVIGGEPIGYVRMNDLFVPRTAWITDVVVLPRLRRQGVGSALILAVHSWALDRKDNRSIIEMPSKNNPAIQMAQKLGFEFCGYNDNYYESQDIALFFGRSLR